MLLPSETIGCKSVIVFIHIIIEKGCLKLKVQSNGEILFIKILTGKTVKSKNNYKNK